MHIGNSQPQSLMQVRDAIKDTGEGNKLRFSDKKGVYAKTGFSGLNFRAIFSSGAVKERQDKRDKAIGEVQALINRHYQHLGIGNVGDKVIAMQG